ncbi:Zinc finger BED domain-containing protein RICESLEEPER 2 [Linum perenne]
MEWNDDEDIQNMAFKMKDKVFKYWSEHEETNVTNHLMYLAPIFDPRYKWSIITYTLPKLYGLERGEELCIEIREELIAMFNVYKENHERTLSQSTTSLSSQGKATNVEVREGDENDGDDDFFDDYTVVPIRVGERAKLDKYLLGEREEMGPPGKPYDVLGWWKGVAHKFHVVSEMAKDILAVPISTVASESCFSTRGRVLDNFRSSLTPQIVEALICAEDWLRTSYKGISNEERLEDLQALDQEFERIALQELHSPTPQPSSTCVGDQASASSILRLIVQNIVNNTGEGGNLRGLETIVSGDKYSDESTPCMSGASDSG